MQPRKARDLQYDGESVNTCAHVLRFRRNDAGVKCLIPGDGDKALHEKARQWGQAFHNGQPEYSGIIWFDSAVEHDRIKSGQGRRRPRRPMICVIGLAWAMTTRTATRMMTVVRTSPTRHRRLRVTISDRYRSRARALPGIDGHVSLGRYARKSVQGYVTEIDLANADGERVPWIAHALRGGDIEVFVNATHPVFTDCVSDLRDFAWMEIAESLRTMQAGRHRRNFGNRRSHITIFLTSASLTPFASMRTASCRTLAARFRGCIRHEFGAVGGPVGTPQGGDRGSRRSRKC